MAQKLITVQFTNNGLPTAGLSPVIDIYELNPTIPTAHFLVVTAGALVEIGGGWYRYDFMTYNPKKDYVFTIDGGAALSAFDRYKFGGNESYEEDVSSGVWEEQTIDHTTAGTTGLMLSQIKADTNTIVLNDVTFFALLNTMLKYERNRTRIDTAACQLLVYDNDGTSLIQAFDLKDGSGNPSVADVLERVPTM